MKILMVHNFYQIGGGEHIVFENETRLLREHGHEVVEYTRNNEELNCSVLKKVLLPISSVFSLRTYRDIKQIIRRERIELVHCHNTFPLISPAVYYAARKCGVPVVQTVHNVRFLCPCGLMFRDGKICEDCLTEGLSCALKHNCYRDSKLQTWVVVNMMRWHRRMKVFELPRYIFLTEFNREMFRPFLGDRVRREFVKGNFEYLEVPEVTESQNDRDGSFVYIGRLDAYKGILFLLDTWKENRKQHLYIFGDGQHKEDVLKAASENPYIHYMGFQGKATLAEYLSRATALIFPSECLESFGLVIIEAYACGTPVVCTDIGNQAELVRKYRAGSLFAVGDSYSFALAVWDVTDHFDEMSRNARKAYLFNYTPEANYQQLEDIYQIILSGKDEEWT